MFVYYLPENARANSSKRMNFFGAGFWGRFWGWALEAGFWRCFGGCAVVREIREGGGSQNSAGWELRGRSRVCAGRGFRSRTGHRPAQRASHFPSQGRRPWGAVRAAVADPIGLTDLEVCHHDGADTEVRAPVILSLGPGGQCARRDAQRMGAVPVYSWFSAHRGGRFRMNAHGSGHRGPPPRRPVTGSLRAMCSE